MNRFMSVFVVLLGFTFFTPLLPAAPPVPPVSPVPPGQSLTDQVIEAYRQTQQYQATVTFTIDSRNGRWHNIQETEVYIAWDRATGQLKIDKPDLLVVVGGGQLLIRSEYVPGRHVEAVAPDPLTLADLAKLVQHNGQPLLTSPPLIDVAFLLSASPIEMISDGFSRSATPLGADPADPQGLERLTFPVQGGMAILSIDPQSKLIRSAVLRMTGVKAGDALEYRYEFKIEAHNKPIAAAAFEFDTTGSVASASLDAMVRSGAVAGGGGGAGGGGTGGTGGGVNPLIGQAVPAVKLTTLDGEEFDLADIDADVIVLDFWATWCPPCRVSLPSIQAAHDWSQEDGLSVAVFAVNIRESPDVIRAYWQSESFTMPVLRDAEGSVASGTFGGQGIPMTVFIVDGKVAKIQEGIDSSQDLEKQLKSEIQAYLDEVDKEPINPK